MRHQLQPGRLSGRRDGGALQLRLPDLGIRQHRAELHLQDQQGDARTPTRRWKSCSAGQLYGASSKTSEIGFSFIYNTLDDAIKPTSGMVFSFSQDFAGFGGNLKFLKTEGTSATYHKLFGDAVRRLAHRLVGLHHRLWRHGHPDPGALLQGRRFVPRLQARRHRPARPRRDRRRRRGGRRFLCHRHGASCACRTSCRPTTA